MMTKDFANWFIDYAGQNYRYNIETSTIWQLTNEELTQLTQGLYKKYGIEDVVLTSVFCPTCQSHDATRPYHLDGEWILDLTQKKDFELLNRAVWTEADIQREIDKKQAINAQLKDITKDEHADTLREAYTFYSLFWRVVEGLEQNYNFMLVQKDFFHSIYALNEKEINEFLDKWMARIDLVDSIDGGKQYQMVEI